MRSKDLVWSHGMDALQHMARSLDRYEQMLSQLLLLGFGDDLGDAAETLCQPGGLDRLGDDLLDEMRRNEWMPRREGARPGSATRFAA